MDIRLAEDSDSSSTHDYHLAISALNNLPDHCAADVGELADRIGTDKLELIKWVRADVKLARLIASKMAT